MRGIKITEAARSASISPSMAAALKFLARAPKGQVFTLEVLAEKLGYARSFLGTFTYLKPFAPYRCRVGRRCLYGSVAAIRALKKQLAS